MMNSASSHARTLPPLSSPDLDRLRTRVERGLMRLAELSAQEASELPGEPLRQTEEPSDRRKLPRRDGNCHVFVCLNEHGLPPQEIEWRMHATTDRGILEDVSLAGAAIRLPREFPLGAEVILRFASPRLDIRTDCKARVLRAQMEPSGNWKIICEFTEKLTLEEVGQFSRFLEKSAWI